LTDHVPAKNCSGLASDDQHPQSSDDTAAAAEPQKEQSTGFRSGELGGQMGGSGTKL